MRNPPRGGDGKYVPYRHPPKRKSSLGAAAAGVAVAVAVAAGGGGLVGAGGAGAGSSATSGTSGSGSAASRSAGRAGDSRTARARDRDQDGVARRLARTGREVRRLGGTGDVGTDCAAVSYGEVRVFFTGTPCDAVGRALFEVREGGARAVVAVAVVDMPTVDGATALRRLVDTHGTGNVRELRTPRGVRWTGRQYASARDGATVVNAQAEPLGGSTAARRLAGAAAREAARG